MEYEHYLDLAQRSDDVVVGRVARAVWVEPRDRPADRLVDLGGGHHAIAVPSAFDFVLGTLQEVEEVEYLKRGPGARAEALRLWCPGFGFPRFEPLEGRRYLFFVKRQPPDPVLSSDVRLYDARNPAAGRVPLDPAGVGRAWGFCGCDGLPLDLLEGGENAEAQTVVDRLRTDLGSGVEPVAEEPAPWRFP